MVSLPIFPITKEASILLKNNNVSATLAKSSRRYIVDDVALVKAILLLIVSI